MRGWIRGCIRVLCCAIGITVMSGGVSATAANWLELNFWLEGPQLRQRPSLLPSAGGAVDD